MGDVGVKDGDKGDDDATRVAQFPDGPRDDERIERLSQAVDVDEEMQGYVLLLLCKDETMSFKFCVPGCPAAQDRMLGALDRIRHRLIQYAEMDR